MTVKIRIGEIIRSRYLIANQRPRTSRGKEAHQITISGNVMLWRNEVICQGKGANRRYSTPIGIVEMAPEVVETSTSCPKPDSAPRASALRLRCNCCMLP